LAGTTYNYVLSVGMRPKMRPVGVTEKRKKKETFMRQTGYMPRPPTSIKSLKFCMRRRVRKLLTYFKFCENRSRGLRAVEGRKSPSPIDNAHGLYNSLYCNTRRDPL